MPPVTHSASNNHFGLYIQVTDDKTRRRLPLDATFKAPILKDPERDADDNRK